MKRNIPLIFLAALCLTLLAGCRAPLSVFPIAPTVQVTRAVSADVEPTPTPIVCRDNDAVTLNVTVLSDSRIRLEAEGLPPDTDLLTVYTASVETASGGHSMRLESPGRSDGEGRYSEELGGFAYQEYEGAPMNTWQAALVYGDTAVCAQFTVPKADR